jgi:membrane protein required for colicin V production
MIYGYSRGLIKEILSILSIIISVYISINLYPNISLFIKQYIEMAVLADSISFALMFLFLYSLINIFSNFIVSSITNTPIRILDKNFGIIFGFFRALLILSLLNILLYWTLWKKNIPQWLNDSKSMVLINYTSNKIIRILPSKSLKSIEQLFNISLDNGIKKFINKEKQLDKYNEPVINLKKDDKQKGYSESDNDSLDKLFNIESNN